MHATIFYTLDLLIVSRIGKTEKDGEENEGTGIIEGDKVEEKEVRERLQEIDFWGRKERERERRK